MESSSPIPTLLTREHFISPDHVKVAATQSIMYKITPDGEGVEEVPVPASVRATGTIPDGYTVDFAFDPLVAIHALKRNGYTTAEQLPAEMLKEMKGIINSPKNLKIVPKSIHEEKLALVMQALAVEDSGPTEERRGEAENHTGGAKQKRPNRRKGRELQN